MAYVASALSLMLAGFGKPIVLSEFFLFSFSRLDVFWTTEKGEEKKTQKSSSLFSKTNKIK